MMRPLPPAVLHPHALHPGSGASQAPCPCGRRTGGGAGARPLPYAQCCGPLHQADSLTGPFAADAQTLMRSRYSAFVLENAAYLLATWAPQTRPATIDFDSGAKWLGLEVRSFAKCAADQAEVEFVARCKPRVGAALRLHERSRFVHDGLRWLYLDGVQLHGG